MTKRKQGSPKPKSVRFANGKLDSSTSCNVLGFYEKIQLFFSNTLLPIMLMMFTPNLVMVLWYAATKFEGSLSACLSALFMNSSVNGFQVLWSEVTICSPLALGVIFGYSAWAVIAMKFLPGKQVEGPVTPKGNIPVYTDNGFTYYLLTLLLLFVIEAILQPLGMSVSIIYDKYGDIVATLNILSFLFCGVLYIKGLASPSSSDSGSSGNIIFDYYWGMELYPRIFGIDIKMFTNCRFGMMGWALLATIFCIKNYQLYGFVDSNIVSTTLQLVYITKFFWWEAGYLRTIDIMLDRAGFYICWGCLVFVPGFYTVVSMYMVNHPVHLGTIKAVGIFLIGLLCIAINYLADMQKQAVRSTNGSCSVWGKKPELIRATYTLESGEKKESILLVSGWWGLSRHFHYIPEILLAVSWSVPALFSNFMPYAYVTHLVILLTHRSYRDDRKCSKKYGSFWDEYRQKVPSRIIPYIF